VFTHDSRNMDGRSSRRRTPVARRRLVFLEDLRAGARRQIRPLSLLWDRGWPGGLFAIRRLQNAARSAQASTDAAVAREGHLVWTGSRPVQVALDVLLGAAKVAVFAAMNNPLDRHIAAQARFGR